jgi:hypothetical protein
MMLCNLCQPQTILKLLQTPDSFFVVLHMRIITCYCQDSNAVGQCFFNTAPEVIIILKVCVAKIVSCKILEIFSMFYNKTILLICKYRSYLKNNYL